jgi:hypothetical protein
MFFSGYIQPVSQESGRVLGGVSKESMIRQLGNLLLNSVKETKIVFEYNLIRKGGKNKSEFDRKLTEIARQNPS